MRWRNQPAMLLLAYLFENLLQTEESFRDHRVILAVTLKFNFARATGYFLQEFICHLGTCRKVNLPGLHKLDIFPGCFKSEGTPGTLLTVVVPRFCYVSE